jgi:hypothetical protein
MVYSQDINENLFEKLVECIKKKGTIISNRHYSKSNLYVLFINGEIKRYINIFEAFNNLYAVYNCQRNFYNNVDNYLLSKNNALINGKASEEEKIVAKREVELVKCMEDALIKDVFFTPLTEMDKYSLELKVKESKLSSKKKIDVLKNIQSMINIKYQNDISVMSITKRSSYRKILNGIISFLDRLIYKYEN